MEVEIPQPSQSQNQNNSTSPTSPGKRKKDYVYKFWTTLSKRCESIIEDYKSMQSQTATKNDVDHDIDDPSKANNNNNNSDNDVEMKENPTNNTESNKLTFDRLGEFMRNKQLILLVGKFWSVLQAYMKNEPIKKESIKEARIILSTLMIAMFPHDVLDVSDIKDMDALSEACYDAAQQVLKNVFEKQPQLQLANETNNVENSNQTKFHCEQAFKAVNKFFQAFQDWQSQDRSKILASVLDFYEQWQRSYQVLKGSNMNEAQRDGALQAIETNANNMRKKILSLVDGNESEMKRLCDLVDNQLKAEEAERQQQQQQSQNPQPNATANLNSASSESNSNTSTVKTEQTVEEKLRARGVPVNMKSGKSLATPNSNSGNNGNNDEERKENDDSKYIEEVDGKRMLNLDSIIMEEASKNYWIEFEKQIDNENWSRLFELLSEILQRVKKISPKKDHQMLDDMIDVSFLQQTIQNGLIDATGFYGIFHGIWKQLRSLHAPIADAAWDAWHDKILKDMEKSDATWGRLLSTVFNTFLMKIDEVEDQIKAIQAVKDAKK